MVQVDQLRTFGLNPYTGDMPVILHFDSLGAVWSDGKRRTPAQAAEEFNTPNPEEVESACACMYVYPASYKDEDRT